MRKKPTYLVPWPLFYLGSWEGRIYRVIEFIIVRIDKQLQRNSDAKRRTVKQCFDKYGYKLKNVLILLLRNILQLFVFVTNLEIYLNKKKNRQKTTWNGFNRLLECLENATNQNKNVFDRSVISNRKVLRRHKTVYTHL